MADPLKPANCACFNLRRAARQITQRYDQALRGAGIQSTQFTILATIAGEDGDKGITMTTLANRLGMDRTTLSRNLGPVQRHGWVETMPGADRRARLVGLTPAGRAKLDEALPLWRAAQARTAEALGADGLDALIDISRQVTKV